VASRESIGHMAIPITTGRGRFSAALRAILCDGASARLVMRRSGDDMAHDTVRAGDPKRPHDAGESQAPETEYEDPLALDPYSPIVPGHAPTWNDSDPLALDPYSPRSSR
jgi:hypothetical protein